MLAEIEKEEKRFLVWPVICGKVDIRKKNNKWEIEEYQCVMKTNLNEIFTEYGNFFKMSKRIIAKQSI